MKRPETSDFISHTDNHDGGDGWALLLIFACLVASITSVIIVLLGTVGWPVPAPVVLFIGMLVGILPGACLMRTIARIGRDG